MLGQQCRHAVLTGAVCCLALAGQEVVPHRLPPHRRLDPAHRLPGAGERCEWLVLGCVAVGCTQPNDSHWLLAVCTMAVRSQMTATGCWLCVQQAGCCHAVLGQLKGATFLWLIAVFLALLCPTLAATQIPRVDNNDGVQADAESVASFFSATCAPGSNEQGPALGGGAWSGMCSGCKVGGGGAAGSGWQGGCFSQGRSISDGHLTVCRMPEACSEQQGERSGGSPDTANNALMSAAGCLTVSIAQCTGCLYECACRATAPTTTLTGITTEPCAA